MRQRAALLTQDARTALDLDTPPPGLPHCSGFYGLTYGREKIMAAQPGRTVAARGRCTTRIPFWGNDQ